MNDDLAPVPDADDRPKAYRDPEVLRNLYIERSWRRQDIADHFGVSTVTVHNHLTEHGIADERGGKHAPQSGPARELYERGLEDAKP